jgi:hypothetical protein
MFFRVTRCTLFDMESTLERNVSYGTVSHIDILFFRNIALGLTKFCEKCIDTAKTILFLFFFGVSTELHMIYS